MKTFSLITCFLFLFATIGNSEVTLNKIDNAIYLSTDKVGVEGFKGCQEGQLKKVHAYTFELFKKVIPPSNGTCPLNSKGATWISIGKKVSEENSVVFENMLDGVYKATCYSGEPLGCNIEGDTKGYPPKSIVLRQEHSEMTNLGQKIPDTSLMPFVESDLGRLEVFPNPTLGEVNIRLDNKGLQDEVNIVVYDLLGRVLQNNKNQIDNNVELYDWTLDLSKYSEGTYIIRLIDSNGQSLQSKVQLISVD